MTFGQTNLVPNAGFENYSSCTWMNGNLPSEFSVCIGWTGAMITPEYYNSCATNSWASVPWNSSGYQYPNSGNAYAGIYTYNETWINVRETILAQLNSPMTIGIKYYVKIMFCSAIKPNSAHNAWTDRMGVRFSTMPTDNNPFSMITNWAHVYSQNVISDTLNWTKVKGSFIADSTYNYITVGNFWVDGLTNLQPAFGGTPNNAFYYIDDICVSTDSLYCEDWNFLTSLNEQTTKPNMFKFFPNPASTYINLDLTNSDFSNSNLTILNSLGKILLDKRIIAPSDNSIPIDNLSNGTYFIRLKTKYGQQTEKLIIIR